MIGNPQNNNFRLLGFLINPLLAFIFTLNSANTRLITNMFFAWCLFFGFTYALSIEAADSDIMAYISQIEEVKGFNNIYDVYEWNASKGEVDFYSITIIYITHLIGGGYNTLTLLFSILFAYFLSKNIQILLQMAQIEHLFIKILVVTFFMLNPIWNINGVRFYTALNIIIFSLLKYIFFGNKKYMLLMFITPLVHFSFFIGIAVVLVSLIFQNRPKTVFAFFVASVFISEILTNEAISQFFDLFKLGTISDRGSGYLDNELREMQLDQLAGEKVNWYIKYLNSMIRYPLTAVAISLYLFLRKQIFSDNSSIKIFSISYFIYSMCNLLLNHFVLGRFFSMGCMVLVAFFVYVLQENNLRHLLNKLGWIRHLIFGALCMACLVVLRIGLYSISVSSILSNPIIALFERDFKSINDLIKF